MFQQISNKDLSKQFDLCAKLLELLGENEFKIKAYSVASFKINKHPIQLYTLTIEEIENSELLSKSIKPKVIEILTTGQFPYLDELAAQMPPGFLELLQIKGLGVKKIKLLHEELGIQSIGELLYACQENRLTMLKGFGEKTQDQIIKNIQFIQSNANKFRHAEVEPLYMILTDYMAQQLPNNKFYFAGEYSRHCNIISSIEIFTDVNFNAFTEIIFTLFGKDTTLIDSENNSIKIPLFPFMVIHPLNDDSGIKMLKANSAVDFYNHHYSDIKNTTGLTDIEILHNNNLPIIPAPQREITNANPYLSLQEFPIKGLIHCHSTWSDGANSILEMAEGAIARGMEYMVITDHSVSAFYANGLSSERVLIQHKEIEELNQRLAPFKIFKGIEADILYNGQIDYNEDIWKTFDVIIASIHSQLKMSQEKATERILTALENPYVKILGHPTGRLILSREGYPLDYDAIFKKCQEKNIIIEINAHPARLDLDWTLVNQALSYGLKLCINSDAHTIEGIDVLKYGVISAQKTQMTAVDNVSSFNLEEFEALMK